MSSGAPIVLDSEERGRMRHGEGRGRIPAGFVGFLAILLVVEAALARSGLTASHLTAAWVDARADATSAEVRESGVICLGDSQIKEGVLATVVSRRLGVPAYSLAVQGGQPPAAYFLLRRAVDAGARPRAVVVGFFHDLVACDVSINVAQWPEALGLGDCLDLAWTSSDLGLLVRSTLGLGLASFRGREPIREAVRSALLGEPETIRDAILAHRRNWRLNRGSQAMPPSPGFADVPAPDAGGRFVWRPEPENLQFTRRLLDLAARHGIAVYWVMPTISPAHQAVRERRGIDGAYEAFVRRMQGEFPGLVVLDARRAVWDRGVFHDSCHLDRRGAIALSEAIADAIAAGPSPSRWVGLSPRPAGADEPDIEDVDQSRMAQAGRSDRTAR
jgi:hypothetical protein